MNDIQEKFFTVTGGEISLRMAGKWYIVEVIRQVASPYNTKYEQTKNNLPDHFWNWDTIITFDYPCLPRENIMIRVSASQNGIERAATEIKNQ